MLQVLQDEVHRIVEERAKAGLKQNVPSQRIRLNNYPDYLTAFDLNAKGKSHSKIGKLMWEGQEGDLKKKAIDYIKQGKKLVANPPLLPGAKVAKVVSKLDAVSKKRKSE